MPEDEREKWMEKLDSPLPGGGTNTEMDENEMDQLNNL